MENPVLDIFTRHSADTNLLTSHDVVAFYLQEIDDKLLETQVCSL